MSFIKSVIPDLENEFASVVEDGVASGDCDIFIDTHGVGFVYPMVKYLFGAKVLSYTHYPTIGSDMIKPNLSFEKKTYYQILM